MANRQNLRAHKPVEIILGYQGFYGHGSRRFGTNA
jgi:hypothetical protein